MAEKDSLLFNAFGEMTEDERRYLRTGKILSDDYIVDEIFRQVGQGSSQSKIAATLFGFDHETVNTYVEQPDDNYGMVFFTKPAMNLSYNNILKDRVFQPMASRDPLCTARIVQALLDPTTAARDNFGSPVVDPYNAFIVPLSSTCTSLSGWPDRLMKSHSTAPGKYEEVYVIPDGTHKLYGMYPLSATFNNIAGDIIGHLFEMYVSYMGNVIDGTFQRRLQYQLQIKRDYDTRIYVLELDVTRTFLQKITMCGAAFPEGSPVGTDGNVERGSGMLKEANRTVNIPFKMMGAFYRDAIAINAFNTTVVGFNPYMGDLYRSKHMVKIPKRLRMICNHAGYPRINILNSELEWWLPRATYDLFVERSKLL